MTEVVEIVEVGARDGLQNEPGFFPTEKKLQLLNRAMDAGVKRLEVASFVHPKLVPQMADAEAVVAGLPVRNDVTYIGLVLNKRGLFRALETRDDKGHGIDEAGAVAVASDGFGQKNQGMTSAESITVTSEIVKLAKQEGISAQVTISTAFGCPFDGEVDTDHVIDMVKALTQCEPREIAIADTIGVGVPHVVTEIIERAVEVAGPIPIRAHFHNTRNTGIANAWAAYQAGARVLDASLGGLGGCPFAPNATGNIATEDLLYMLSRSNIDTGINLDQMIATAQWLEQEMNKKLPTALAHAGNFPK